MPNESEKKKEYPWRWYYTLGLLAYLVGIVFIPKTAILWTWLLTIAVMVFVSVLLGRHIRKTKYWFSFLVNEQNRVSLSRLQMWLWTVVVLSAFLAAYAANERIPGRGDPLAVAIPNLIWLAMGISTASLVGSPLILSNKEQQETNTDELDDTMFFFGDVPEGDEPTEDNRNDHSRGQLYVPEKPSLVDLVRGEEVGNARTFDLSRLQNLLFTLILVGAYAVSLGSVLLTVATGKSLSIGEHDLVTSSGIFGFPPLDDSAVALLGISHAAYLSSKAVPKQEEGD